MSIYGHGNIKIKNCKKNPEDNILGVLLYNNIRFIDVHEKIGSKIGTM